MSPCSLLATARVRIREIWSILDFLPLDMCNECKENKASTCRSCQLRGWQTQHSGLSIEASQALLKIGKLNSFAADAALEELMEMLDDDQETGPAGGPAVAKKLNKPDDASSSSADVGEVFITQAPYLDHEYSHCQKHLRRQEENRCVEAYNARYRQDRLHLLRGLAENNAIRNASLQHSGFSISTEESETENSMSIGDDFDSYKRDSSDSDMLPAIYLRPKSSEHGRPRQRPITEPNSHKDALAARKRRRQKPKPHTPHTDVHPSKPSRRSSRTIRAPKRPYDDLEDGDDLEEEDRALEMDMSLDNCGDYPEEEEMYEMSHYRFNSPLPYTGHYQRRSRLVPKFHPPITARAKSKMVQVYPDPEEGLVRPVVRRRKPYQNDAKMTFKADKVNRSSDFKVRRKDRINPDFLHMERKRKRHQVQEDSSVLQPVGNKPSPSLTKNSDKLVIWTFCFMQIIQTLFVRLVN